MKKVWRLYDHLSNIDWIFLGNALLNCTSLQKFGITNYLKEVLSIMVHFENRFYYRPEEWTKTQNDILNRVIKNPDWGMEFNHKLKKRIGEYFNLAHKIEQKNLTSLGNKELANLWNKIYHIKEEGHASGIITTWILDADEQPFTKYLTQKIATLVQKAKIKEDPILIFPILTTPIENSYLQEEEISLFKLLAKAKKFGLQNIKPGIIEHAKKYGWISFGYIGPVKTPVEYEAILGDWIKQGLDETMKLKELTDKKKELLEKQKYFLEVLKPDQKLNKLIKFAQQVIFIKDYRKMSQFYGSYINEKILKEIAKRLSLSLKQVRQFFPWEIEPALLKKNFDKKVLDQRYEFSVFYTNGQNFKILVNKEAKNFLKKQNIEKIKTSIRELRGAVASQGKATGLVKIVNTPEEVNNMKTGEIMISRATYPALVPAMKKAAAIVTDEGGITSHAAIVSRELGIPCVIGTRLGTKVFKNGDKIEVDAEKGIIRKLG